MQAWMMEGLAVGGYGIRGWLQTVEYDSAVAMAPTSLQGGDQNRDEWGGWRLRKEMV